MKKMNTDKLDEIFIELLKNFSAFWSGEMCKRNYRLRLRKTLRYVDRKYGKEGVEYLEEKINNIKDKKDNDD